MVLIYSIYLKASFLSLKVLEIRYYYKLILKESEFSRDMQKKIICKQFYFIRHGQTEWNRQGIKMGQKDVSLNEEGIRQAHDAAKYLQDLEIKSIVTSPLSRASQTAEIINSYLSVPIYHEPGFKELCLGIYEGTKLDYSVTKSDWVVGNTPEGVEHFVDFKARVVDSLNNILQKHKNPLIVAHGGVYWIIMRLLGFSDCYSDNCIPYLFAPKPDKNGWLVDSLASFGKFQEL
jgi:broad specificity phosphatase PhoE